MVSEVVAMKIAVTGSNGMVGKALVEKLAVKGHKVLECSRENCDVLDPEDIKKALKGAEVVVHMAAQLDEKAADLWEVNVKGTENVLEASAESKVQQFIFLSTVGVYGLLPGMKDEGTEPKPETLYEKSKLEAEKKVLSFQEVFHVTVLRPAIVVGENKYWGQIIKTIGKNFPLIGRGKNHWQALCLEDLADAIVFCINREECFGETFIVAEKEVMTLEELVLHVRGELGMSDGLKKIPGWLGNAAAAFNSVFKFSPLLDQAYVKRLQADRLYSTGKLEKLGWKARHSARECLSELVKKISGA